MHMQMHTENFIFDFAFAVTGLSGNREALTISKNLKTQKKINYSEEKPQSECLFIVLQMSYLVYLVDWSNLI